MKLRLPVFLAWLLAGCVLLTGCAFGIVDGAPSDDELTSAGYEQWVVITFSGSDDEFPVQVMDALLDTELAADEALARAGLGMIDGNEVGDHDYQLYFVGVDRQQMWQVLEPVFADAPVLWTRVELFKSLDDDPDQVILPR